jgi:hypothetical protein
MSNTDNLTSRVQFVEKHVGGNQDDSTETFKNQKELINQNTNDYMRLIDYYNKLERTKDENDGYIERLDVRLNTNPYRLNTLPTTIEGINYSNPIIFPPAYDEYFEYLGKKGLGGLNTKVLLKKVFVNVDSANRDTKTTLNLDNYLRLQDNSLVFTNNQRTFKILINNAHEKYTIGQKISLRGFSFYKVFYQSLNFYFKDNFNYVILDLKPNFITTIPYYDILINISGVINGISTTFKNIPLNIINQIHKIDIYNINSDLRIGFTIPLKYYSDNVLENTLISDCEITFYNLGNYPISLLNAKTPISDYNLIPYHTIAGVSTDYIEINLLNQISLTDTIGLLPGYWLNNNFYTGQNIEIASIIGVNVAYPTPSSFTINLDSSLNNIALIKVISSEIPNVQKNIISNIDNLRSSSSSSNKFNSTTTTIGTTNNKLYWENLLDLNTYFISIPTGYYNFQQLQNVIINLVNNTPRVSTQTNLYLFNNMEVILDESSNTASFKSFNLYYLPLCLQSYNKVDAFSNSNNNKYIIRINHPNHNLNLGDRIYISDSTDYYIINKTYINNPSGHIITKIINNNFYEITLENINLIGDTGDTHGGYSIQIKTPNSFRLRFDFPDTFGLLIGFRYVGNPSAITIYSSETPTNTITNLLPYVNDVGKILITNNTITPSEIIYDFNNNIKSYILLQCTDFNTVTNPNGVPFFYKFLMSGPPNTIVYNSFVNTPTYINPPIRTLSFLNFKFVDTTGNEINFYNRNYSLTIEIDSFDNAPENTGINTFTARL